MNEVWREHFTLKQLEVLDCIATENPRICICSGAKRAGKTYVLGNIGFLGHIAKFQGQNKDFILGGNTYASIHRNVLNDWARVLGVKGFHWHKDNHIEVLGNKVYIFGGCNANSYESVRGFTAFGCFLNEATTLHETFVKECISRCSGEGAVVYMDTNPENPLHFVKTDYIDKAPQRLADGRLNIVAFNFTLDDNTKIDPVYMESIKASTPSGVYWDRDILGRWVNAEGVVYKDFNASKHIISYKDLPRVNGKLDMIRIWGGIDWGYKHKGSICVLGMDKDNKIYVLEEYTKDLLLIDAWVLKAKELIKKYGNITFYADSARPDCVVRFRNEKIRCINGNKNVKPGIETVSKLLVQDRLLLVKENIMDISKEFGLYAWDKDDEPLKTNDDALDALRYAIYSDYIKNPDVYFPLLTLKKTNRIPEYYR
ncbi:PBSX family phage terminase large subunit [Paraclostridium bifermentans]|uniref:PBSX family phage terminase large subunit n=1 Tax=Paraclostridium bifermentans TaxID=1490 RepID=UPI00242B0D3B|nr:PBSX family phage terminase large subunit [Paraclostridium bifermentans]